MSFKWKDTYITGINQIDNEHMVILDEYEKLYNLMKIGSGYDEFYKSIDFLEHHVNTHLENEEKLQMKINYVHYDEHKKMHDELRIILKKFIISIRGRKITAEDLLKLNQLFKMFVKHMATEDSKIGEFIRNLD